ncbi:phosphoribosyltransferase family protein [Leifsonia aquatica]|uniref:phosphoribosyltransferase family protein n=1 Tax=Leifsonia aquatica TaxID=144185 RepID=UPI000A93D693|nr:phosphoribosyltransferase family protein [Leifsonia aquatica]
MIELRTIIGTGFVTTPTFEAMRFPAGESHVKIANENAGKGSLTEVARLYGHDPADLFTLAMWADAVHQRGSRAVAQIPYLPGARADRGLPFGAKVYAKFLNELQLDKVVAVDVHSPVMENLVERLAVVDSAPIIRRQVVGRPDRDEHAQRHTGIIAPDKGARRRAEAVAAICGLPVYQAEKHRDEATGKLSGFSCEPLPEDGKFLVVDDICDGGGTFMGLAAATGVPRERLDLWVTHGVFTGAAPALRHRFGHLWTTDSFSSPLLKEDWLPVPANFLTRISLAPYMNGALL